MKVLIKEHQLEKLVFNYLDSQPWYTWDIGDGEFNVADGEHGQNKFMFRIQLSSLDPEYEFDVIYISDEVVTKISKLFSMPLDKSIEILINWFNKKYNKKLTLDNFEWIQDIDNEDNNELYEHIIKEEYNKENVYPKEEVLRLLKGAPKELRAMIKTLPSIPCENDKGIRTICTRIPETMWVYLTGRY